MLFVPSFNVPGRKHRRNISWAEPRRDDIITTYTKQYFKNVWILILAHVSFTVHHQLFNQLNQWPARPLGPTNAFKRCRVQPWTAGNRGSIVKCFHIPAFFLCAGLPSHAKDQLSVVLAVPPRHHKWDFLDRSGCCSPQPRASISLVSGSWNQTCLSCHWWRLLQKTSKKNYLHYSLTYTLRTFSDVYQFYVIVGEATRTKSTWNFWIARIQYLGSLPYCH